MSTKGHFEFESLAYLFTDSRPRAVLAKGSDSVKGVGPTPVDQMHRPYLISAPSCKQIQGLRYGMCKNG